MLLPCGAAPNKYPPPLCKKEKEKKRGAYKPSQFFINTIPPD